jgi:hypothetical protein
MKKFSKKALIEIALKAIKELDLVFFSDVVACLPCSRRTAYNYNLQEDEDIQQALNQNRIITKSLLRKNWLYHGNATAQIALYKLIATDEERAILNNKQQGGAGEVQVQKFEGFNFLPGPAPEDEVQPQTE